MIQRSSTKDNTTLRPVKRLSLFGHPVLEGEMLVDSINTIRLERIRYDFHLGPLLD